MTHTSNFFATSKIIYFLLLAGLLPLSSPSLPGNATLVDCVNIAFIFLFIIFLSVYKKELKFRLIGPVLIIFLSSLIAMFNAQALTTNLFTLVQDIYLFLFFLLLYNVIEDQHDAKILVGFWLFFCTLEGIFAILSLLGHFTVGISKVSQVEDFSRARGTFGNPDILASYLGISFFLIFYHYINIRLFWKIIMGLLVFAGMITAKSMSGLLAFIIGNFMVFVLYWSHISGTKKLKLSFTALVASAIIILFLVPQLIEAENFFGRGQRSADSRIKIWAAGYNSFIEHPLGIGAGAFKEVGNGPFNNEGSRAELHSDYISHLVERGPGGLIGLLMLYGTLVIIIFNRLKIAKSDQEFLWASGLAGMLCFILIDALNHEGMHYRHVWFAFALIAVQSKLREPLNKSDNYCSS